MANIAWRVLFLRVFGNKWQIKIKKKKNYSTNGKKIHHQKQQNISHVASVPVSRTSTLWHNLKLSVASPGSVPRTFITAMFICLVLIIFNVLCRFRSKLYTLFRFYTCFPTLLMLEVHEIVFLRLLWKSENVSWIIFLRNYL